MGCGASTPLPSRDLVLLQLCPSTHYLQQFEVFLAQIHIFEWQDETSLKFQQISSKKWSTCSSLIGDTVQSAFVTIYFCIFLMLDFLFSTELWVVVQVLRRRRKSSTRWLNLDDELFMLIPLTYTCLLADVSKITSVPSLFHYKDMSFQSNLCIWFILPTVH